MFDIIAILIKAITFDLDGVYFVNGKSNFINALGEFGVTEEEAVRVFLKSDQMNKEYKCGKMTDEEYWSWAISEWNIELTEAEVVDLLIKGYEINDEVVDVVKKVRQSGYKTLICSNNFPARISGLQERFKFLNNFDVPIFSYEVGATKPDQKIFETLVEKSGVNADEIVFADDNDINLAGARDVGINAFFYEDFSQFTSELNNLGVKLT